MFLQKATHDLDYVSYVTGLSPLCVCAMKSKKIFGGKRPAGLRCKDCPEHESCPEFSFVEGCKNDIEVYDYCSFSEDVGIEDCGSIILEYETGVQGVYSQSFVTRHGAKKRGARFIGYKGTVEFDFYTGKITVYDHMNDTSETINVENGGSHFGGDKFLVNSFIEVMKHGTPSASPLSGGIISAETCLAARKSSEEHVFVKIEN